MKKILFFLFLNLSYLLYSQVGIGTTTPRGDLDLNSPLTNVFGLVLPTNADVANMQNPQGGSIAFGTMMYDSSGACIKFYKQNIVDGTAIWSNCLLTDRENPPSIDYIVIDNSFRGNYTQNVAMTAANTFQIAVTNTSFTPILMNFARTDLTLSGIEGIEVSSVSPTSVTLQPGQVQLLTYTLTGAATDCGPLTGTWEKISLQYTATVEVKPNITYACDLGTWSTPVAPEYRLDGLIPGQSYTGTYTIPYNNAGTCSDIPAETITHRGLTLTFAGAPAGASGIATYVLSGTYTGPANSGWALFTTAGGCEIYIGPCSTCKEILEIFPGTPSGVYKINVDKQGPTFATVDAQCDMTTDGGGWTLVANYAVTVANQPFAMRATTSLPTTSFINKLPLIGTNSLGVSESGNTTTFGSGGNYLGGFLIAPTEWRVDAARSNGNNTTVSVTAHWKAPMTADILSNMVNSTPFAKGAGGTALPGNNVPIPTWGSACCSGWGGRISTGEDGTYAFWNGYIQVHKQSSTSSLDNAIYRMWVR